MRAAVLEAPERLQVKSLSRSGSRPRRRALIRVGLCGVRGTDRAIYRDEYPVPHPITLGHELFLGASLGAIVLGFVEAIGYALLPGSITYLLIFTGLIIFLTAPATMSAG